MVRETRMPAVQVEALPSADQAGAGVLRAPDTTTRVGRAIAEGVRRFFEDEPA